MTEDAKQAFVKDAVLKGHSSGQMGAAVGVTRNVIIGFAHRRKILLAVGLAPHRERRTGPQAKTAPRPVHHTKPQRDLRAIQRPVFIKRGVDFDGGLHRGKAPAPAGTLLTTKPGLCHFPMFSDKELKETTRPSELAYCCAPTGSREDTYCPYHHGVLYRRISTETVLAG